jgi:AraC family transcriptional regulator
MEADHAAAPTYHGYDVAGLWSRMPQLTIRRLTRGGGVTPIPQVLPGYRVALSLGRNQAWLSIGRRVCTAGAFLPGTCVLGQPGEAFDGEMRGPSDVLLFLMEPAYVEDRLAELGLPSGRGELRDLPPRQDFGLHDLATRLATALDGGVAGGTLYSETLVAALTERIILRHASAPTDALRYRESLAPARLRRLLAFIDGHLGTDLHLADLAAVVGLSPAHLARAFRNETGMPIHRYVLQRRLARARDLLVQHGVSVGAAASLSGFCDAAHLSKAYKRAFGDSPSQARQSR